MRIEQHSVAGQQNLAITGNAVFNIKGLSPTLENIACPAGTS